MDAPRPEPLDYESPRPRQPRRPPIAGLAGRLLSASIILLAGAGMACAGVTILFTSLARGAWTTEWTWLSGLGVPSLAFLVGGLIEISGALAERRRALAAASSRTEAGSVA